MKSADNVCCAEHDGEGRGSARSGGERVEFGRLESHSELVVSFCSLVQHAARDLVYEDHLRAVVVTRLFRLGAAVRFLSSWFPEQSCCADLLPQGLVAAALKRTPNTR